MGNCCSMGKSFNYAKRVSSRDLLCNTIPVVNNTLLCTVKDVKRLAPMFKCSYHSHTRTHTQKESFQGGGQGQCLACGDGIMGLCICPNPSKFWTSGANFVCQLCFSKS